MNHTEPAVWREFVQFFTKFAPVFILAIALLAGFLLRLGSLAIIDVSPENFYLFNTPMLTSIDGYYYLNNAKQLIQGTYSAIDPLRAFPEGGKLPAIAPLLSYLVAYSAKILAINIHWTAAVLPMVLSLLICFPLYAFGNRWGGQYAGYFAVLIGMTAYIYATRTAFGMLDTDCLNVTFPLAISWCYLKFAITSTRTRYLHLILAFVLSGLFLWWWDVAPSIVLAFSLFPFLVALTFYYRPMRLEGTVFLSAIVLLILVATYLVGVSTLLDQATKFVNFFLYVTKNTQLSAVFPNTGISNMEQEVLTFLEISTSTVGSRVLLAIALIGFALLVIQNLKECLFLLPLFVVSALSLTSVRFLIFLVPVIALGFGYCIGLFLKKTPGKKYHGTILTLVGAFILWNSLSDPPFRTSFFNPKVMAGMHNIRKHTPENAIIYGWWDIGHPLVYWSERATLADGMIHGSDRTVYLATPLASSDFRFAANYMQFFGNHGVPGIDRIIAAHDGDHSRAFDLIQKILSRGPAEAESMITTSPLGTTPPPAPWDSWKNYFFPQDGRPVYLFLEDRVLRPGVQHWLYYYGTWDIAAREGEPSLQTIIVSPIDYEKGKLNNPKFQLDETTGTLSMPNAFSEPIHLSRLTVFDKNGYYTTTLFPNSVTTYSFPFLPDYLPDRDEKEHFTLKGRYCFEILPPPFVSFLQDVKLVDSLTKRLFLYKDEQAKGYFRLIDENRLRYQLWEVKGESP